MKRIESVLKGKTEKGLVSHKIDMFNNLIENAKLSAKDDEINAECEMQKALKKLSDDNSKDDMRSVIREMCQCIANKRNAKEDFENLEAVRKYVNEEVEVDPDEK